MLRRMYAKHNCVWLKQRRTQRINESRPQLYRKVNAFELVMKAAGVPTRVKLDRALTNADVRAAVILRLKKG